MLSIIILGFILFIAGVAGTFLYDKRHHLIDPIAQAKARGLAARKETAARRQQLLNPPVAPKKTTPRKPNQTISVEDLFKDKPLAKVIKPGDLPEQAVTLEELISKIESFKNKAKR